MANTNTYNSAVGCSKYDSIALWRTVNDPRPSWIGLLGFQRHTDVREQWCLSTVQCALYAWCVCVCVCVCVQCYLGAQEFDFKTITVCVCVCVCVCVVSCLGVRQMGSVGYLRGDAGAPAHALFIPPP